MIFNVIPPIPPNYALNLQVVTSSYYNKPNSQNNLDTVYFRSNKPYVSKANQFPDLKQNSIKGWEEYYCGPTSLANGMVYLSENGYPKLAKSNGVDTINLMADYLHTDRNGTTTNNLCLGIKNILKDRGYTYKSIEYQGARAVDSEFSKGKLVPNLNWIKAATEKKGIVLLNIGVYNKQNGTYQRDWGHWVTVVGHGFDGKNKNPNSLIIQDPYKKSKGNMFLTLEKLNEGKLNPSIHDDETTLNNNAEGYYKINSQIPYLGKNETAIINGAIALEM